MLRGAWIRCLATATVVVIACSTVLVWSGTANAATRKYHYLQFNAFDNLGTGTPHDVRGDRIVDAIVDWGNDGKPLFVSLNELCGTTADDIRMDVRARGLDMNGLFTETLASAPNCPGGSYGNMVMYPGLRTGDGVTNLSADPGTAERRKLTCVSTSQPGNLRMCVTHLSNDRGVRVAQVGDVRAIVDPYALGSGFIAVGGDFNERPELTNATLGMYASYGGYFNEVDRAGSCNDSLYNEFTHSLGKIDYTFIDGSRFFCWGGTTRFSSVSDHRFVRGAASLNY